MSRYDTVMAFAFRQLDTLTMSAVELRLLAGIFYDILPLSLVTFGGVNVIIPQLYRVMVDQRHFLSGTDFYHLLALAFAAPGPNMIFVAMLGSRIAGVPGAIVATLTMILPTSLLAIVLARLWFRANGHPLRDLLHKALVPITAGIFAAATIELGRAVVNGVPALIVSGLTLALIMRTRLHPLWLLAAGALIGVFAKL